VRRKAEEENADQKLKRAEMFLENQSEELRQLKKMYEADDMTEETEEIILKRQQDRVEAAEFELRMQRLAHARSHGVLLPREAVKLAEAERDTAIAIAKFEHDAPRAIALKKIELQNLKTVLEREKQTLENLKADRKQFEITAPADGWFYHGAIENERWSPGEAAKSLVVQGRPAVRNPSPPSSLRMRNCGLWHPWTVPSHRNSCRTPAAWHGFPGARMRSFPSN
jgi:HlyD family secretion protein